MENQNQNQIGAFTQQPNDVPKHLYFKDFFKDKELHLYIDNNLKMDFFIHDFGLENCKYDLDKKTLYNSKSKPVKFVKYKGLEDVIESINVFAKDYFSKLLI